MDPPPPPPPLLLQLPPHHRLTPPHHSLLTSFSNLQPSLKPPFTLHPPTGPHLTEALLYAFLTQPHLFRTHLVHLHATVSDGYDLFTSTLTNLIHAVYPSLPPKPRAQILNLLPHLLDAGAVGIDGVIISLLRRINGGDFSEGNLWLCRELVTVVVEKWDCVPEGVFGKVLYVVLRLVADHWRLRGDGRLEELKRLEVAFCVRVLRERFESCLAIGRDLVRLLQDVVFVPELRDVWRDLVFNPSTFGVPGFHGLSLIYRKSTPREYFRLRVTVEMEERLRFLLTRVKWVSQRRYQEWFERKFLSRPEQETVILDLIRFVCCCVCHESDGIAESDVVPRWAVIGWLLKCCKKNYFEANAKLALFYDWLFFDEKVDNVMNVEPAMLLMVNSLPKYPQLTNMLMEFLFLLVDNYDICRKHVIAQGVSESFRVLVKRGVVHSLDPLTLSNLIPPVLRNRLSTFLSSSNSKTLMNRSIDIYPSPALINSEVVQKAVTTTANESAKELLKSRETPLVQKPSSQPDSEQPIPAENKPTKSRKMEMIEDTLMKDVCQQSSPSDQVTPSKDANHVDTKADGLDDLVKRLRVSVKESKVSSLRDLKNLLMSVATLDVGKCGNEPDGSLFMNVQALGNQISDIYKSVGCDMFLPLNSSENAVNHDEAHSSVTATILQAYIIHPPERMGELLLFWSRRGCSVGAHFLAYVCTLDYEARKFDRFGNSNLLNENGLEISNLKYHVAEYISKRNSGSSGPLDELSTDKMDSKLVLDLVGEAFNAYRSFLKSSVVELLAKCDGEQSRPCLENNFGKRPTEMDQTLRMLLLCDLSSCSLWNPKRTKELFQSVFFHFFDLAVSRVDFIKLLLDKVNHLDLVATQFEISLKQFTIFGENSGSIRELVKSSLTWDFAKQKKLWGLLISELLVSTVQVEQVISDLCTDCINPALHSIATEGIFTLIRSCSPTPELIRTLLTSPSILGDLAAATLASWAFHNCFLFVTGLSKSIEWLNQRHDAYFSTNNAKLNSSVVKSLLKYFNRNGNDVLNSALGSNPQIKVGLLRLMEDDKG